jgi:uncharacterized repeat protein (TIGR01451 family)
MRGNRLHKLVAALLTVWAACLLASPAAAASCSYATSQGTTGPGDWQTYCWLDLSGYNNTNATSAGGQNFNYTLPDGTTMTFNLKVTTANALTSAATPSWTGAAVGNTAFLGISGKPILYQTGAGGTSTVTISNIVLTPPASGTITNYMFVAGDGESTNGGETLKFQTSGGGTWQMLDQVGPISGSTYPSISGVGSSTFTETGADGNVGAYIVGSTNPTQVVTTMVGSGLQGAMFAVRFASIRLNTQIVGTRIATADQFTFTINTTGTGSLLASGTSTGTLLGPFTAAALSSSAAIPITLNQSMAAGSTDTIGHYHSVLSCTNAASSSTPMPSNVATTSYNFGSLQFGDAVQCTFSEAPYPHLTLKKTLGSRRQYSGDQFVMNINQGATTLATTTTTGSSSTVNNGSTPQYQGSAGTTYTFVEAGAGSTALDQYNSTMSCTNLWGSSSTTLPTSPGGSLTPQYGDVITCTINNVRRADNVQLSVTKVSIPVSDPVRGTNNPVMIPGAVVRYTIYVQNSGENRPDTGSILIVDGLPSQLSVGTASSPVFTQGSPSSGLTWPGASGIRYSNSATKPTQWSDCTYSPTSQYDPSVKFVCLQPGGHMNASSGTPPNFSISIEGKIK